MRRLNENPETITSFVHCIYLSADPSLQIPRPISCSASARPSTLQHLRFFIPCHPKGDRGRRTHRRVLRDSGHQTDHDTSLVGMLASSSERAPPDTPTHPTQPFSRQRRLSPSALTPPVRRPSVTKGCDVTAGIIADRPRGCGFPQTHWAHCVPADATPPPGVVYSDQAWCPGTRKCCRRPSATRCDSRSSTHKLLDTTVWKRMEIRG